MQNFLIAYNRRTGHVDVRPFGRERKSALEARFKLEIDRDPDLEVVVVSADSESDLRRTHARYFQSVAGIARDGSLRLHA